MTPGGKLMGHARVGRRGERRHDGRAAVRKNGGKGQKNVQRGKKGGMAALGRQGSDGWQVGRRMGWMKNGV